MRFLCARQAWHDAFMTDLAAPDFATQAANVGVQKTARGADNAIVDHCERGFIIAAVHRLREVDYIAYCWGMIAYAPRGAVTEGELAAMHGYLRTQLFSSAGPGSDLLKLRYVPEFERRIKLLALIAATDAGEEDFRQGVDIEAQKAARRMRADLANLIGIDLGEYNGGASKKVSSFYSEASDRLTYFGRWHQWYKFFIRCCEPLPRRALGVVAAEVNRHKRPGEIMLTPDVQTVGDVSQVDIDAKLIGELTEALSVCESAAEAKKVAKRFMGTIGLRK